MSVHSQQLDISGVQMGMSFDQAKAKIGSGYTYYPQKLNDPKIDIQYATKGNEIWVLEAISGKLAYAHHLVYFQPQARPNSQDTVNRLTQKYGPPSTQSGVLAWAFSSAGVPLTGEPYIVNRCADGWQNNNITFDAPGSFTRQLSVPGQIPQGCGVSVVANIGRNDPPHLLDRFEISIVDVQAQAVEVARFAGIQQQQQTDTLNRGKQNKAPF